MRDTGAATHPQPLLQLLVQAAHVAQPAVTHARAHANKGAAPSTAMCACCQALTQRESSTHRLSTPALRGGHLSG
jgi:hypothetical protein